MTLQQLRDYVRYRVGQRTDLTTGTGLTNLDIWINTAKQEIEHSIRFTELEEELNLPTATANQRYIDLSLTSGIYAILSIYDVTNARQLDPFDGDYAAYERQFPTTYSRASSWLHFADRLYLTPGPDSADVFRAGIWRETADLTAVGESPVIPGVWHEAVAILALRNAWRALDEDARASAVERGEYASFIRRVRTPKAIESHNSHRRGVRVNRAIRNPRFGV